MAVHSPRSNPDRNEGSVLEAERVSTKPPPMYRVLLLNDDYTPMDFVVGVLQQVFMLTREQATQVMLQVHRTGVGTCGVLPKKSRIRRSRKSQNSRSPISIRFSVRWSLTSVFDSVGNTRKALT